jgi:hypothetical protein
MELTMTDYRPADRVLRIPWGLYADLEESVIRITGLEPDRAQRVVDAVLGPLRLAPDDHDWNEVDYPCGHAYWAPEGEWSLCIEEGPHGRHMDAKSEHWSSSDPHDVDLRRFSRP